MSTEIIRQQTEVISLNHITPEQILSLREVILSNNGEAMVLIHPFYDIRWNDETEEAEDYNHKRRVQKAVGEDTTVVIIFESKGELSKTTSRLASPGSKYILCTLETESENAHPNGNVNQEVNERWTTTNGLLKDLGIKKVKIGGRKFYYDINGKPSGCVAQAIEHLQGVFEIEVLPNLCFPDKPYFISIQKKQERGIEVQIPNTETITT